MMTRFAVRFGLGSLLALAAAPSFAAMPSRHRHHFAKHAQARHIAKPAVLQGYQGGPSTVYGASAPYYVFGPGGGDAYGDDPIGGPEHVGDGGPGANLGGGFGLR